MRPKIITRTLLHNNLQQFINWCCSPSLSPVRTQILILAKVKQLIVSGTPSCNLSSMAVAPRSLWRKRGTLCIVLIGAISTDFHLRFSSYLHHSYTESNKTKRNKWLCDAMEHFRACFESTWIHSVFFLRLNIIIPMGVVSVRVTTTPPRGNKDTLNCLKRISLM